MKTDYRQYRPGTNDILIISDFPSKKDFESGGAFSQDVFVSRLFQEVGLNFPSCHKYTILDYYPAGGNIDNVFITGKLPNDKSLYYHWNGVNYTNGINEYVERVLSTIERVQPATIIGMGALTLAILTGERSISAWRGSDLEIFLAKKTIRFIPTFRPGAIQKKFEWRVPFKRDLIRAKTRSHKPEYRLIIEPTFEECRDTLLRLLSMVDAKPTHLSCDIETRGDLITVLGIAWSECDCLVTPFTSLSNPSYFSRDEEFEIACLLRRLLGHRNTLLSGQNFQYDVQYLAATYGIQPNIWRDSMVEAHGLWTRGLPLNLGFLASIYCDYYRYWKDDAKEDGKAHATITNREQELRYWRYNAYDCCYTWEIVERLDTQWSGRENVESINFQRCMQNHVLRPSLRGMRFDAKKQAEFRVQMEDLKQRYRDWFEYIIPNDIINKGGKAHWCDSPTRLSHFLYKELRIKPVLDKKTYRPTTSSSSNALQIVGEREPLLRKVMDRLEEYRSITQFLSLYLQPEIIGSDNRVHTSYSVPGTDTFRLASKKDAFGRGLNFQNITKG